MCKLAAKTTLRLLVAPCNRKNPKNMQCATLELGDWIWIGFCALIMHFLQLPFPFFLLTQSSISLLAQGYIAKNEINVTNAQAFVSNRRTMGFR